MSRAMVLSLLVAVSSLPGFAQSGPIPGQAPKPPATAAHAEEHHDTRPPAEIAAERDLLMNQVLELIKGHENEPAENVFKNIQSMKGMPAGRVPRIMNMGFARSLGVSCLHCHVPGEWEKDDKPEKGIAREMMGLSGTIGAELEKIKGLENERPTVNCTTCHRGQLKPATDLGAPPPAK